MSKYENLLPPLSSEEFAALKASIKSEGVRVPVAVDEEGEILDGHHRSKCDPDAPRIVIKGLSEGEKVAFVLSSNLTRRNMTADQKAELRERQIEAAIVLSEEDKKTQPQIAALLGVARQTVTDWLNIPNAGSGKGYKKHDSRVKLSATDKEEIADRVEKKEPQTQIAADFGVAQKTVSLAAKAETKKRAHQSEIDEQEAEIAKQDFKAGEGAYAVVVIDPPWPYGTAKAFDAEGFRGGLHYPEMSLEGIGAFVEERIEFTDDCVLWLWTTHKFMRYSFPLLDQWGFRDVSILTWVKNKIGMGRWLRSKSEYCIMAVKGKPQVDIKGKNPPTTVLEAPTREHSRKPDEFYTMVNRMCSGRALDVFSREERPGWDQIGSDSVKFGEEK